MRYIGKRMKGIVKFELYCMAKLFLWFYFPVKPRSLSVY